MSDTTLKQAHRQWASRPADETFTSVPALHDFVERQRNHANTAKLPYAALRVEANEGEISLIGRSGLPATLTHWSFGQLSQRAGAPPSYLRTVPPTLAAQCINHGLKARASEPATAADEASLLFNNNGSLVLRALTSDSYSRIWNSDITSRLLTLIDHQPFWHAPKAYDRHNGAAGTPDKDGMVTRGLYASDRDLFVFLVDDGRPIRVAGAGNEGGVKRGFFIENSEVGAGSFAVTQFCYDHVCGNHYVWGASNVTEIRVRHVGDAPARAWGELEIQLKRYAESSAGDLETKITKARMFELGKTKDEVLDAVFASLGRRAPAELSRKTLGEAYDIAVQTPRYGSPRTPWALASGLTELSQKKGNADDRTALDRAAGKVIEIAF